MFGRIRIGIGWYLMRCSVVVARLIDHVFGGDRWGVV